MMEAAEPWQKAEIPGPTKALVITTPQVVVAMVKKAKRPILIVGHEAAETEIGDKKLIDYAIRILEVGKIPVVATAQVVGEFVKRGFQPSAFMPAVDIANRLTDSEWKGLDGNGQYDLAMFMGITYYMEWILFSALKHFGQNLKTISLDRYYHPHASLSFPNLSVEDWAQNLEVIVDKLKGE
jgi:acetyl-CoA decarbonylase/synthase complex subunit epsilon